MLNFHEVTKVLKVQMRHDEFNLIHKGKCVTSPSYVYHFYAHAWFDDGMSMELYCDLPVRGSYAHYEHAYMSHVE